MQKTNSNNILIFDKIGDFKNLLIHYCGKKLDVTFLNNRRDFFDQGVASNFNIAFVTVNHLIDLKDLFLITEKAKKVFVITNIHEVKIKVNQLDNTFLVDIENKRFEIMNFIFNNIIENNKIDNDTILEMN